MSRFRLTPAAKIICLLVVVAVIGTGVFFGFKNGMIKNDLGDKKPTTSSSPISASSSSEKEDVANTDDVSTINLSLDEWIGWKPIIDANQGLTTQPGSIFDELGLDVKINIINDATQSSNALISGDLQAAGYTTNRVAFLSKKFQDANFDVVMPYFSNYSNGGDGIIASTNFADINTWTNARIGVPSFSEAETLVAWFIQKSDLSESDKTKILDNLIMFDTPDDAAKAFFAGQIDVAATWEPYLSQAEESTNSVIVFDTTASSSLIMDGIVFDADWASAHPDTVSKFIDGCLQASDLYTTDFDSIRAVMPIVDPVTSETYSILTTNMDKRYFNAMKNKVHFLGVCYIDRDIVQQKTGRKNIVTGKEEIKGRITGEKRVICFRDDNFSVDSKSRFADIVDRIPLDVDSLISAVTDAIKKEHDKGATSYDDDMKKQKEEEKAAESVHKERIKKFSQAKQDEEDEQHRDEYVAVIAAKFPSASAEVKAQAKEMLANSGAVKFSSPDLPIADLKAIAQLFE